MTRRAAFTLIEVLVTVAIIALLVSIAMPSISAAKRLSKRTYCAHNLHAISIGIEAYLNQNKDYFPHLCRMPSIEPQMAAEEHRKPRLGMPIGLARELSNKSKVFECPADFVSEVSAEPPISPTLRVGGRYFDSEGTSYDWTEQVNGLHRHTKKVVWRGIPVPMKDLPLVFDFEAFHGKPDQPGSLNTLWADLHLTSK